MFHFFFNWSYALSSSLRSGDRGQGTWFQNEVLLESARKELQLETDEGRLEHILHPEEELKEEELEEVELKELDTST